MSDTKVESNEEATETKQYDLQISERLANAIDMMLEATANSGAPLTNSTLYQANVSKEGVRAIGALKLVLETAYKGEAVDGNTSSNQEVEPEQSE